LQKILAEKFNFPIYCLQVLLRRNLIQNNLSEKIKEIARDIVNHFESRLGIMDGKGIIVCMSRRICIDLYDQIIKLRPNWNNEDDRGFISLIAGKDISILFFIYYCFQLESGIGGI
jgi:hypothetical protein